MPPNPDYHIIDPFNDMVCQCELCQEAGVIHDPGPLEDCFWIWRERLKLITIEDCVERLAQEASLWLVTR